jgi:hypothetical protein
MKKELFAELLQSVNEAAAIERGEARPSRKFEVKTRQRRGAGAPQARPGRK